jgi:hypothetical protein
MISAPVFLIQERDTFIKKNLCSAFKQIKRGQRTHLVSIGYSAQNNLYAKMVYFGMKY